MHFKITTFVALLVLSVVVGKPQNIGFSRRCGCGTSVGEQNLKDDDALTLTLALPLNKKSDCGHTKTQQVVSQPRVISVTQPIHQIQYLSQPLVVQQPYQVCGNFAGSYGSSYLGGPIGYQRGQYYTGLHGYGGQHIGESVGQNSVYYGGNNGIQYGGESYGLGSYYNGGVSCAGFAHKR